MGGLYPPCSPSISATDILIIIIVAKVVSFQGTQLVETAISIAVATKIHCKMYRRTVKPLSFVGHNNIFDVTALFEASSGLQKLLLIFCVYKNYNYINYEHKINIITLTSCSKVIFHSYIMKS